MEKVLDKRLEAAGISRREFLKYCGGLATLMGLSSSFAPEIAAAIEKAGKKPSVVYIELALCTGCTESLLRSTYPTAETLILDIISLDYLGTVMAPAGDAAEKNLTEALDTGEAIAVIDGAVPTKEDGSYLTIGKKTGLEIAKEASDKAKAVVAYGTCSSFGGLPAASPNLGEAKSAIDATGNKGIINVPTCPGNPKYLLSVLLHYLLFDKVPELDSHNRPLFIYGDTIHNNCERRAHFEAGEFVEEFGSKEEDDKYCLYKMGCKGPETHAACSRGVYPWNEGLSWCVPCGNGCIGCAEPNFWDEFKPFYQRLPSVAVPGVGGVSADTIGKVLGVATVAGLGIHLVGQIATGRVGKGGPPEGGEK